MDPTQLAAPQRVAGAAERLRKLRVKLGITTREIENLSRKVAEREGNEEFIVSHARITQIENGVSTPSLYKLFSLSAIYGVGISDLLSYYVDAESCVRHHMAFSLARTHLTNFDAVDAHSGIDFPIRFDPGFSA